MAILPQMYSLAAIYGQNTAIETYFAANIDDTTGLVYDLIWMSFTRRNRDKIEAKSHFAVYRRFRDQIKKKTPGQGLFGLIMFAVYPNAYEKPRAYRAVQNAESESGWPARGQPPNS